MNDINPGDAGLVKHPETGLKGIRDMRTGETLWYQGTCRGCSVAMYGYKPKPVFYCSDCLTPPTDGGGR